MEEAVGIDFEFSFCICPICQDQFKFPVSSCRWGHSFCEECISGWMRHNKTCPTCRNGISSGSLVRNLTIEQAVEELRNFMQFSRASNPSLKFARLPEALPSPKPSKFLSNKTIAIGIVVVILAISVEYIFRDFNIDTSPKASISKHWQSKINKHYSTFDVSTEEIPFWIAFKVVVSHISTFIRDQVITLLRVFYVLLSHTAEYVHWLCGITWTWGFSFSSLMFQILARFCSGVFVWSKIFCQVAAKVLVYCLQFSFYIASTIVTVLGHLLKVELE